MKAELQEIASQFALEGAITAIDSLGEGFINDTFIVRTAGDALQKDSLIAKFDELHDF